MIRKACLTIHNANEVEQYFAAQCKAVPGLLLMDEFVNACTSGLGLSPPLCDRKSLEALFNEMDSARSQKLTMDQIRIYVARASSKSTKELQDDILEEIASKVLNQPVQLDNLFKQDDPRDTGKVQLQSFNGLLQRTYQVKDFDAKYLALRYVDYASVGGPQTVLYKKFI
jgi:Ca2+-binding EF-hand superfamily protein